MTLDEAERLASAGWCVEDRLDTRDKAGRRPEGRAVLSPQDRLRRRGRDPRTGYRRRARRRLSRMGRKASRRGPRPAQRAPDRLACIGEAAADVRRASDLRAPATMSMYNDVPSFDPARTSPTSSTRAEEGNGAARQRNKARTRNWRSHRAPSQMMRDFSGQRTTQGTASRTYRTVPTTLRSPGHCLRDSAKNHTQ